MSKLRLRVRFDYEGKSKSGRFFGGRNSLEVAEELRQQKASLMRNLPIQGIEIEEIDMSQEVYTIHDEVEDKSVSYAPIFITLKADSLEPVIKYAMSEEFRTVEFIEPEAVSLTRIELERLLRQINDELMRYKQLLERKRDNWK